MAIQIQNRQCKSVSKKIFVSLCLSGKKVRQNRANLFSSSSELNLCYLLGSYKEAHVFWDSVVDDESCD